jgi:2-methylcitrate dehydratase PrpD
MALADDLARRALSPVSEAETAALRTVTLTNVSAAAGYRGRLADLINRLPLDSGRAPDAAYLLATQLHARTQDDFFPGGRSHVGAIVLAATLALADEVGDRTLSCLAAGYRTMCDVSAAYWSQAQQTGLRPSGVFGPFGSAAAAAVALSLSPEETVNAIALAAAACGGHNQAWISSSDEWLLEVGAAARAGVEAALFTRAGARAATGEAFEGSAGWAAAFFGEPGAPRLAKQLTGPITDATTVAIKPYPVSGIAQMPTQLACALHTAIGRQRPTAVRVHMSPAELEYPGSTNTGPFTSRSAALMSVAFCVAAGLLDGALRLDRLDRPGGADISALMDDVVVTADHSLAENESRVEVDWGGGRTLVRTARAPDLLYPSWAQLTANVTELAQRCEASQDIVRQAMAELSCRRPDATQLRALLERSRATEAET